MPRLIIALFASLITYSTAALAEGVNAKLIQVVSVEKVNNKDTVKETVVGLVNMDEMYADCSPMVHRIKVEGVQFSSSGTTLESFRYIHNKVQWSVPTNISVLSNVERSLANSYIKVGQKYLVHIQVCGSGGFPSLINMYSI